MFTDWCLAACLLATVSSYAPPLNDDRSRAVQTGTAVDRARATPWSRSGRSPWLDTLYGSYVVLHVADAHTTISNLRRGQREINPVFASFGRESVTLIALKAASTATTVYFVERVRRKSRRAAIVLMVTLNGATAAVVAHNLRQR